MQDPAKVQDPAKIGGRSTYDILARRALLLLFGLGVLGYLIAIDRAEWFSIRPATGTSVAMANASTAASTTSALDGSGNGTSSTHP